MNEPMPNSSAVSPAPSGAPATSRARRGPETVINPERRAPEAPVGSEPLPAGPSVKSSIVRILFPADDDQAVPSFDAQAGVQLGHFTIIERIRTGGMGAVFRA